MRLNNIFTKNNAKLIGLLVSFFIAVSIVVASFYYGVCTVIGTETTGSDVANIFVASATLLGPIILILSLSVWKEQHNKGLERDIALTARKRLYVAHTSLMELTIFIDQLFDLELRLIDFSDFEKHDELTDKMNKQSNEFVQYIELFENYKFPMDDNKGVFDLMKALELYKSQMLDVMELSLSLKLEYSNFYREFVQIKNIKQQIKEEISEGRIKLSSKISLKKISTSTEEKLKDLLVRWKIYTENRVKIKELKAKLEEVETVVIYLKLGLRSAIRAK